jgi:23S rRNA pseudouridine2605 synthase
VPHKQSARNVGLARALSKLGYCSRLQAAELIRAGRVRINGSVRRNAETPVRLQQDRLTVDGLEIEASKKIYLMMNKPRGLVTTASDEKGRPTVYSLLSGQPLPWLAPVGRLDKASEGLLLLTNDSGWAASVTAPATHLEKTYHVQIGSLEGEQIAQALIRGVREKGEFLHAAKARQLRVGGKNCWLEIVLDEGRNRQIRRMLAALGVEVLRLVRIAIGPLALGDLPKGAYRFLTAAEKRAIDQAMSLRLE